MNLVLDDGPPPLQRTPSRMRPYDAGIHPSTGVSHAGFVTRRTRHRTECEPLSTILNFARSATLMGADLPAEERTAMTISMTGFTRRLYCAGKSAVTLSARCVFPTPAAKWCVAYRDQPAERSSGSRSTAKQENENSSNDSSILHLRLGDNSGETMLEPDRKGRKADIAEEENAAHFESFQ